MSIPNTFGTPLEKFHSKILGEFHKWRKSFSESDSIEINGSELNTILAKAKNETISEFPIEYFTLSNAAPDLLKEMERMLVVIQRIEDELPATWSEATAGTGIATANAYRLAIAKAKGVDL
jgi:hypothetical protein